jgi:hypothetical protein
MTSYQARRGSFWRRRLELRIALPAPLLAAVALIVVISVVWIMVRPNNPAFEPVAAPELAVTRAEVTQ